MNCIVWEKIYEERQQINRYPYGELVTVFFNSLQYLDPSPPYSNINVLEVGCGAGNNLWFLAETGFRVFGVDGSEAAVIIAKECLASRGLDGEVVHGYFHALPYEDNSMEIIIDRESLYCGTIEDIKLYLEEVRRVLKSGGIFISFRFSDKNPVYFKLKSDSINARQLDRSTWTDLDSTGFKGTGCVNFLSLDDVKTQYSFLEIKSVSEHSNTCLFGKEDALKSNYAEYIIVGVNR